VDFYAALATSDGRGTRLILWWIQLNKPSMLTEKGREFIADKIPSDTLDYLRTISKSNFFDVFQEMRRRGTFLGKPRLVID
jgi:hypothetical protein